MFVFVERISEIQYQNRILLRKMLQIDLSKSKAVVSQPAEKPISNPNGLNSYSSLNRAVRIKEIARVADDNKSILSRLQNTKSHYSSENWETMFKQQRKNLNQIQSNGDRFCKNPYFLHSVSTLDQQVPYGSNPSVTQNPSKSFNLKQLVMMSVQPSSRVHRRDKFADPEEREGFGKTSQVFEARQPHA